MTEQAVLIGNQAPLVGIVTPPEKKDAGGTAFLLLNAGIVHRVGPNRLYVTLARQLSRAGCTVLRFDHSGIGDSGPRKDDIPFEQAAVSEVQDAMDWLAREKGSTRFVLVGLCSGALTAFRAACRDPRVSGLVLLTALLESPESVSADRIAEVVDRRVARSYFSEKALDPRSWAKFFSGRANYANIARVLRKWPTWRFSSPKPKASSTVEVASHLERLVARGVSVLFVFADPTTVLEYFRLTLEPEVRRLRERGNIEVNVLKRSDHTFSGLKDQRRVIELVLGWQASFAVADGRRSGCS